MDEKLEFLFEIYDRNGDGTIDVAELLKFVQKGNENLVDELRFTEEVVDALDKDGDGSISRFVPACCCLCVSRDRCASQCSRMQCRVHKIPARRTTIV